MYIRNLGRKLRPFVIFVLALGVIGCGGGGGGGGGSSPAAITDDDPDIIQGKFISPIVGLRYVSGNQSGLTDINGAFSCEAGSTISFYVGDILIGTTACHSLISPVDMVPGATDETHPTVSNIFAFLQTIDDDNDPSNGITITQAVRDAAANQSVTFDQSTAAFATDPNVLNIVASLTAATTAGAHALVDALSAQHDLNHILLESMAGIYNGTYSCDAPCEVSGTWSMTVTNGAITGSVCNTATLVDFPISGSITSNGTSIIEASGSGGNADFSGTVTHDGQFTGAWSADSEGGSLSGSRQGVSIGGTCMLPSGNFDITGADTGSVGFSFIPVYDALSYEPDTEINTLAFFDINPFTSPNVDTRTLEIVFSNNGTPLAMRFRLYRSGLPAPTIWGEYIAICTNDDCSGVSINTDTQTITLNEVVVFPYHHDNYDNNASDTLSLDGSITYTASMP